MKRFRITYADPETREDITIEREFGDTPREVTTNGFVVGPISARTWAEDFAYALADKGSYKIEEIRS
ncbi:hypothetical protein [Methylobacterium sp. AMS5]|uniref:hypothetical protein n=1 Tax=Methylobacterium sp. AMS5 TaxID=925818 RepID=UPI00074F9D78|nr:hypothetical protein [Methylobacterium sp. AMS5]AMB48380.1 hypothetical protein Y590_25765 [Methylobacterium sp. AMS5]